jgi:hypothetical protein
MVKNPDYICEVIEEIIEFNKSSKEIERIISIIECAKNDLDKLNNIWFDEEKSKL